MRRHRCEEGGRAADLGDGEHADRDADRHQDQHLDEIRRHHRPAPTHQRHEQHDHPRDHDGQREIEPEGGGKEDPECIEPDCGVDGARRQLEPRENLLIGAAEALADRLDGSDDPQLAEARGEVERVGDEAQRVGDVDHCDRPAVGVGLRRRPRERPRAETNHERRAPHHPPHDLPPAAEVVAHVRHEPPEHPADRQHEDEVHAKHEVVVERHVRKSGAAAGWGGRGTVTRGPEPQPRTPNG